MRRLPVILAFGAVALGTSLATTLGGATDIEPIATDQVEGDFSYSDVIEFDDYGVYAAGSSIGEVPLTAITRRLDAPDPALPADAHPSGANWVNFIYAGDCAPDESGIHCKSMIQIQTWPACERNLSVYDPTLPRKALTVRGSPAAFFPDEHRLEVYTGDSTVVIFAESSDVAYSVADELVLVNGDASGFGDVHRDDPLPEPLAGALQGEMGCSAKVERALG